MKIRKLKRNKKAKKQEYNPRLQKVILDVVDEQLANDNPPETKHTYARLLDEGFTEIEAKKMIGAVVACEIYNVSKEQRKYDHEQFVASLNNLPDLPY